MWSHCKWPIIASELKIHPLSADEKKSKISYVPESVVLLYTTVTRAGYVVAYDECKVY
jgi:hypothetical protein